LSAGIRYDNNVRILPEGRQLDEDLVMVISPQIELVNDRDWVRLRGAYSPSASFYFKNSDLNNLAHSASVGMDMNLSQSTDFSLNDRFGYTKDSLEAALTGIQRERASTTSNALTLGLGHAFTPSTSGSVSLSDTIYRHKGATISTTRTNSASVGVGHSVTERTSLSMSGGFSNIRYDSSTGVDNFTILSLQTGFGYRFSPSAQLTLSAGSVYTPTLDTSRTDWIASATASKDFERTSFSLGYTRNMSDTTGLVSQLNVHETYSLNASRKITDTIDLSLSGSYSMNRTTPLSTVDLTSYGAGLSASWRPYSWLSVNTGYSHFEQVSRGIIGNDFKRDNIFMNFTVTRSRRF